MEPSDPLNLDKTTTKRFAFAPRERDRSDTANSITENSRQRRNRRFMLTVIIGLVALITVAIVSFGDDDETAVQITAENASVSQTGAVALEGVSYQGVTGEGKNFVILAETAFENTTQPDLVNMVSPRARVDTVSGNPITIQSNNGEFMRVDKTVNLSGRVVIVRPDLGYTLLTEEAFADLGKGMMKSEKPVRGFSPNGNISAGGLIITENSEDILFTGKSRLVINRGFQPVN